MTTPTETPPPANSPGGPDESVARALYAIRSRGPDLVFRIALVAGFFVLVWPMLMPVILGGLAAIVLAPLRDRFANRMGRGRALAPGIVTGLAVLGFLLPLSWVAWSSLVALNHFVTATFGGGIGATRARITELLAGTLGARPGEASFVGAVDDATQRVATFLTTWLGNLLKDLPEGVTNLFLFVLALYFGLRDGPKLVLWARRVSPVSGRRTRDLFGAIRTSVNGTMLGMLAVSAVQGSLALLALLVCRVDNALLWGFVAAICSVLPIVGTTPVTLGAAVWLYLQNRPVAALGMLAAAIVIGISDNIVRPWVVSTHDDMHPLVALLAIFGGLAIFGPAGLLLGPVIGSMAVWAVETYRDEPRVPVAAPPPAEPTFPPSPPLA